MKHLNNLLEHSLTATRIAFALFVLAMLAVAFLGGWA